MRVVVECSPCRARIVVILSLVGYFIITSRLTLVQSRSVFVGTINNEFEDCDLRGPSSVASWMAGHRSGPLCGLVASRHSALACRWHVHSTADTWSNISASSVLVGSRTHIELAWPNAGPMVAVGHMTRNYTSRATAL